MLLAIAFEYGLGKEKKDGLLKQKKKNDLGFIVLYYKFASGHFTN